MFRFLIALVFTAALCLPMIHACGEPPKPALTLSGPFKQQNLSIFLMHGKDSMPKGQKIVTLQEAMEQKLIIVHETSTVNQLQIENISVDISVFIQSGDIVKGGKQDRLLGIDMIVPPKSGKLPISSFCCESGRWQKRGREDLSQFNDSKAQVANRVVKLALNDAQNQGEVWSKVEESQAKLSTNVGKDVKASESKTSYQLTLEDKELNAKVENYTKELNKLPEGKSDVIGMVIVINGKVAGADVYGSNELFKKLWPKLLKGAAVDALSELDAKKKFEDIKAADVEKFLAEAVKGEAKEVTVVASNAGNRAQQLNLNRPNRVEPQPNQAEASQVQQSQPRQVQAAQPQPAAGQNQENKTEQTVITKAKVNSIRNEKAIVLEAKDRQDNTLIHRCYIAK